MQRMHTIRLTRDCIRTQQIMNRAFLLMAGLLEIVTAVIYTMDLQGNAVLYCFFVLLLDLPSYGYFLFSSITSDYTLYYCLQSFSQQMVKSIKSDIKQNRFDLSYAHRELCQFKLLVRNFNRYLTTKYLLNILLMTIFPSVYYMLFKTNLHSVIKWTVGLICSGLISSTILLSYIIGKVDVNVAVLNEAVYRYLCIEMKCKDIVNFKTVYQLYAFNNGVPVGMTILGNRISVQTMVTYITVFLTLTPILLVNIERIL